MMHITAEVTAVITELQSRPSEVDARMDLVGWNSSIESAVAPATLMKPLRRANVL
jgi:hypothetical protein